MKLPAHPVRAGPFDKAHGSDLVEELPGHASGEQNVSKGSFVHIVPPVVGSNRLDPAYKAGP